MCIKLFVYFNDRVASFSGKLCKIKCSRHTIKWGICENKNARGSLKSPRPPRSSCVYCACVCVCVCVCVGRNIKSWWHVNILPPTPACTLSPKTLREQIFVDSNSDWTPFVGNHTGSYIAIRRLNHTHTHTHTHPGTLNNGRRQEQIFTDQMTGHVFTAAYWHTYTRTHTHTHTHTHKHTHTHTHTNREEEGGEWKREKRLWDPRLGVCLCARVESWVFNV